MNVAADLTWSNIVVKFTTQIFKSIAPCLLLSPRGDSLELQNSAAIDSVSHYVACYEPRGGFIFYYISLLMLILFGIS